MTHSKQTAQLAPHSWDFEHWPQYVYPHSENRARYMVRSHMDELMRFGALSRVGRELVFDGARYTKWLASKATRVADYRIPPNQDSQAST